MLLWTLNKGLLMESLQPYVFSQSLCVYMAREYLSSHIARLSLDNLPIASDLPIPFSILKHTRMENLSLTLVWLHKTSWSVDQCHIPILFYVEYLQYLTSAS